MYILNKRSAPLRTPDANCGAGIQAQSKQEPEISGTSCCGEAAVGRVDKPEWSSDQAFRPPHSAPQQMMLRVRRRSMVHRPARDLCEWDVSPTHQELVPASVACTLALFCKVILGKPAVATGKLVVGDPLSLTRKYRVAAAWDVAASQTLVMFGCAVDVGPLLWSRSGVAAEFA